jgi:hypothetical protein
MLDKQGYMQARTHKYVIFIAFPQQQWLRKPASMLRYTYIVCLVNHVVSESPQPSK